MTTPDKTGLIRIAAILAVVGLVFMLFFFVLGFRPWTIGLGVFVGGPAVMLAIAMYVVAVVRDLRAKEVL
jgi:hypothetical protein